MSLKLTNVQLFCQEVRELAEKYNVQFFLVADGVSCHSYERDANVAVSSAVANAHQSHCQWEYENGIDSEEDWSDKVG